MLGGNVIKLFLLRSMVGILGGGVRIASRHYGDFGSLLLSLPSLLCYCWVWGLSLLYGRASRRMPSVRISLASVTLWVGTGLSKRYTMLVL